MSCRSAIAAACGIALRTGAGTLACSVGMALGGANVGPEVPVRIDVAAAVSVVGGLRSIDAEAVEVVVDGDLRRIPLADVRTLTVVAGETGGTGGTAETGTPPRHSSFAVELVGDGGLTLGGDDLRWEGGPATLIRDGDEIELPIERIRRAAWRPAADTPGAGWLEAVPAEPAADLVAVTQPEGFELVECAIAAITPTAVTVVLDGERIPVSRRKVLGLVWVWPSPAADAATRVTPITLDGGAVGAATVAWHDGSLVLDGAIRLPGRLLRSIDFAAGRTVPLAALEPEGASSEPFFGGLAATDGVAAFFAPRIVTPAGGRPAWLMRPRASATWRVPEGSRRFRARAVRAVATAASDVVVWARADDGQEWRRPLGGAAATSVEVDVHDARRLTIGVDFTATGVGAPVRFDDAGFEK